MLEKPKKEVLLTETCQGYRPKGAFFPPTILVSGRVTVLDKPHSMLRAAETVTRPGKGLIGDKISVGIVFSEISNELAVLDSKLGNRVLAVDLTG